MIEFNTNLKGLNELIFNRDDSRISILMNDTEVEILRGKIQ